jgi:hypothetical protein
MPEDLSLENVYGLPESDADGAVSYREHCDTL